VRRKQPPWSGQAGSIVADLIAAPSRKILPIKLYLPRAEGTSLIDKSSYLDHYLPWTVFGPDATALAGVDNLLAAFATGEKQYWIAQLKRPNFRFGSTSSCYSHFNEKAHESELSSIIEVVLIQLRLNRRQTALRGAQSKYRLRLPLLCVNDKFGTPQG
jgi:hypothetical protein